MKEIITIENFGGLKEVKIPLNSINIFIGKQASGKSITAKLIYFFKGVFSDILDGIIDGKNKTEIDRGLINKFQDYFPPTGWSDSKFLVSYEINSEKITLSRILERKNKLKIEYSQNLKKIFSTCRRIVKRNEELNKSKLSVRATFESRDKYAAYLSKEYGEITNFIQIFIPAGRSFFANLQSSIFSFLSNNKAIDPFLVEFGSFYANIKNIMERPNRFVEKARNQETVDSIIMEILGGKYVREKNKDYIVQQDNRKIDVSFSSSGQQETLPLSIILKSLTLINFSKGATIYIEEPEAHLFPSAQKKIVELLATVYNNPKNELQFIITTHSPYILTSFNNLLHAGLLKEKGVNEKMIYKIVRKSQILRPNDVSAFAMKNGKTQDLIDKTNGLIISSIIDKVSEEIAVQFDELIDL